MQSTSCIFRWGREVASPRKLYKYADTIQEYTSWLAVVVSRTFGYYIIFTCPEHRTLRLVSVVVFSVTIFFSMFMVNVTCCFCISLSVSPLRFVDIPRIIV